MRRISFFIDLNDKRKYTTQLRNISIVKPLYASLFQCQTCRCCIRLEHSIMVSFGHLKYDWAKVEMRPNIQIQHWYAWSQQFAWQSACLFPQDWDWGCRWTFSARQRSNTCSVRTSLCSAMAISGASIQWKTCGLNSRGQLISVNPTV